MTQAARAGTTKRKQRKVRPVFLVTLARSGSTLLRYLLDSHPDIVSPPELNLSALLQHQVQTWAQTSLAVGGTEDGTIPAKLPPELLRRARKPVDEMMAYCAQLAEASVYVDKSLPTVDHLPTVSQCYPDASFVFLYRYPLDLIASGLEASKWGFNAFGFAPYVTNTPGNFIAGLGNYWIDKVSSMLAFENEFTGKRTRIYYEVLCDDPATTIAELLEFLELPADDELVERAFEGEHGQGPGDYKIDFTGSIEVDSIGRGAGLPELLVEPQIARIDELLADLDYPSLADARSGSLASLLGLRCAQREAGADQLADAALKLLSRSRASKLNRSQKQGLPMELVLSSRGQESVILVDADATPSLAEVGVQRSEERLRLLCSGDVLERVASGALKFPEAVRAGMIKVDGTGEVRPATVRRRRALKTLAALLSAEAA